MEDVPEAVRRSMTAGQREAGATKGRKRTPSGPATSEAAFQKQVIQIAHLHGWRVAHFTTAPTRTGTWSTPIGADGKGWPDLVLVRDRIVFAELKAEKGRIRPDQVVWARTLFNAGAEIYLWKPSDLEEIQEVLK